MSYQLQQQEVVDLNKADQIQKQEEKEENDYTPMHAQSPVKQKQGSGDASRRKTEISSIISPKPIQFADDGVEGNLDQEIATITKSLVKQTIEKQSLDFLTFNSWWIEENKRNDIKIKFKVSQGGLHEIMINDLLQTTDTILSCDKLQQRIIECWDMYVGAKIDIFGKMTVIKQCDYKTGQWNQNTAKHLQNVKKELIKEIRKYDSKPLKPIYVKFVPSKLKVSILPQFNLQGGNNLRSLINQITMLKQILSKYRPQRSIEILSKYYLDGY